MWPGEQQPGDQSGGQQYPSGNSPQQPQGPYGPPQNPPNPYSQPGYPQPGYPQPGQQPPGPPPAQQPYGSPSPYSSPSPYGQQPGHQAPGQPPGGYPTPQTWGPPVPGGPGGGPPRGGRSKATVAVAVGAALAVIAAVVVTVVLVSGDDKESDAHGTTTPSVTATTPASPTSTPTPAPTTQDTGSTGDGDDPRGPAGSTDVTPVVPGWQAVKREERNSVFDVPADWTLDSESMSIGYADDSGKPQVAVGAPAYYKKGVCTDGKNSVASATAGTKGGAGASSIRSAAENEAMAWAKWAFQENGRGTVSKALNSKAFHNSHGISGWQAQATMTSVPKANKCSSNGIAYTVAWLDPAQAKPTPVVWVLWARQGVPDQIAQSVVDKIKSSIRPMKK